VICKSLSGDRPHPLDDRIDPRQVEYTANALMAQVGLRYAEAKLSNYRIYDQRQETAVSRLRDFAQHMPERMRDGSGLLLYGSPGTGKDHLLAALMLGAIRSYGFKVVFRDGMALFAEARKAINDHAEDELRRKLCEPHILALSDPLPPVGVLTDYQSAFIRDIIDKRYRSMLPTWITTNVDRSEDLKAKLTLPVYERVIQNSLTVFCDWESYRTKKG